MRYQANSLLGRLRILFAKTRFRIVITEDDCAVEWPMEMSQTECPLARAIRRATGFPGVWVATDGQVQAMRGHFPVLRLSDTEAYKLISTALLPAHVHRWMLESERREKFEPLPPFTLTFAPGGFVQRSHLVLDGRSIASFFVGNQVRVCELGEGCFDTAMRDRFLKEQANA